MEKFEWHDLVPTLAEGGLTLRAHEPADVPAIVAMCQDEEMARWTTIPQPYQAKDAWSWLDDIVGAGWRDGSTWTWALDALVDGRHVYAGSIDLRLDGVGGAEVGYAVSPEWRGKGYMTRALRMVVQHAFSQGLAVVRWRAIVGNWASRKVAMRAGFRYEGLFRRLLTQRGELRDGWLASILPDDDRQPRAWANRFRLGGTTAAGEPFVLRAFDASDLSRIVEVANDPVTALYLPHLPRPYGLAEAQGYVDYGDEAWANGSSAVWCISSPDGTALGSIELMHLSSPAGRLEVGYWMHPDARGRGLATAAVGLLTDYAFRSGLAHTILLQAAATNVASLAVARANGFRRIGVWADAELLGDTRRTDLTLFATSLRDWDARRTRG